MKSKILFAVIAAAVCAYAGVPIKWSVETSRADERVIDVYHGETLDFEVTFKSYGEVLQLPSNAVAATFWQTNGMGTAYWRTNNVEILATNGIMKASFGPEQDVGAKTQRGFIGIAGNIYRAAFVLRFKDAPGYDTEVVEWPYRVLDFDKIEVHNPPYYTMEETEERLKTLYVDDIYYTNKNDGTLKMRHGWDITARDGEEEEGLWLYQRNASGYDFPLYNFTTDGYLMFYSTNHSFIGGISGAYFYDGYRRYAWNKFLTADNLVESITTNQTTTGAADAVAVKNYVESRVAYLAATNVPAQIESHAAEEVTARDAAIATAKAEAVAEAEVLRKAAATKLISAEDEMRWFNAEGEVVQSEIVTNRNWHTVSGSYDLNFTNIEEKVWIDDSETAEGIFHGPVYLSFSETEVKWSTWLIISGSTNTLRNVYAGWEHMALTNIFSDVTIEAEEYEATKTRVEKNVVFEDELDFSTSNETLVATIEAKAPAPGNYAAVSNAAMSAVQEEEDPTVPSWAKNESKPTYTASEVGAVSEDTITSLSNMVEEVSATSTLIYHLYSGSNVVCEITNYNSSVNPPALRIQQLNESNEYVTIWTETNGLYRIANAATNYTDLAISNYDAAAESKYAPSGWSARTSGMGVEAPSNTTWISTPTTVFAGGLEYEKHATTAGQIWILTYHGDTTQVYTNQASVISLMSADGTQAFSVEKTDSYLVGVDADSISVSGTTVTMTVPVVSEAHPYLRYTPSLDPLAWEREEDGFTSDITAAWSGSSGEWVCTVTTSASLGFFAFEFLQEGSLKVTSNGAFDASEGILCTDGTTKVRPVNNGGTITWEIVP